ncbi:MAG: potassium-transporting ATPase subunit KdpC [Bacteroidales bacterium]|jgi:K+-transporting ATPase ATPase C chain
MIKHIVSGLKALLLMTLLTGFLYPALIHGIANIFFSDKAKGSLVRIKGEVIGSKLIGQNFDSLKYFWPRPSSVQYNPLPSGASNLGPLNPDLKSTVIKREKDFRIINDVPDVKDLPPEILTSSGSGLDPQISPYAAILQVSRVAKARNLGRKGEDQLVSLINDMTQKRQFLILGEPRINVFLLNLRVDRLYGQYR